MESGQFLDLFDESYDAWDTQQHDIEDAQWDCEIMSPQQMAFASLFNTNQTADYVNADIVEDTSLFGDDLHEMSHASTDNFFAIPSESQTLRVSNPEQMQAAQSSNVNRQNVVTSIETIVEQIVTALESDTGNLTIQMSSRSTRRTKAAADSRGDGLPSFPRLRTISFPGANADEAWRFSKAGLELSCELTNARYSGRGQDYATYPWRYCIANRTIQEVRDIFYRHPDLFVKQSVVDRCVDDIACTFGVSRADLNITAAAKGLVAGNLSITRCDGSIVSMLQESEGYLIPNVSEIKDVFFPVATRVVVIEKEATFRSVISCSSWSEMSSHTIAITAKGYPDLSTRAFLKRLASARVYHQPQMFFLVDYDPDGLMILATYAFGSLALAHEQTTTALSAAQLQYLGLKSRHVLQAITSDDLTQASTDTIVSEDQLLQLTSRDRTKARDVLSRLAQSSAVSATSEQPEHNDLSLEIVRELQVMLMLNCKAELQIMQDSANRMGSWLQGELKASLQ